MTGDNKQKTKASMLQELESIKSLLLEDDRIPLLQSADNVPILNHDDEIPILHATHDEIPTLSSDEDIPLLNDTLNYQTNSYQTSSQPVTRNGLAQGDFFTPPHREPLAKGSGENPFLPQHIRERLHGNNPLPGFDVETAERIAQLSRPNRLLGSTAVNAAHLNITDGRSLTRQDLIDQLIEKIMPELQHELHAKLDTLTHEEIEALLRD